MPKKVDYEEELAALKDLTDGTLRPVTTRVPVNCLRKLYQLCDRDGVDLSTLVRQILEEQADLYLEKGYSAQRAAGTRAMLSGTGAALMVQLSAEIHEPAIKACEGLAVDLPTLLQLIVSDAMPNWIMRASKARQQRRQAMDQLENQLTPERATWETYWKVAPAKYQNHFRLINQLIEEGLVTLELNSDTVLSLILGFETACEVEGNNEAGHPGIAALQQLMNAELLVQERLHEGSGSAWSLNADALVRQASSGS